MRADLGGFVVDAGLAAAGLALLWGLGLVERTIRSVLAALGLAYLVGAAVVPLLLIALLVVGVPFTIFTFALVTLACTAAGVGWAIRAGRGRRAPPRGQRLRITWPRSVDAWVIGVFAAALGGYAVVGLLAALELPMDDWDAWSIWTRKAEMLTLHSSLTANFFAGPAYGFMQQDYPLLYPVWQAVHFRAAGEVDTQAIHAHAWLLMIAFVWAAAYLVRDSVRPLVWTPILLTVAVAPGVWPHLLTAYADIPMAIFGGIGALALGLWLADGPRPQLALAAVMLAGAASVKNEGLMLAVAVLVAGGAVCLVSRRSEIRFYLLAALAVGLTVLPWRIWMSAHDVEGYLPLSKGLDPVYLADRFDRVRPTIRSINGQLSDQGLWLYLLPLALLVILTCLVAGVSRRIATFYLSSLALVWASLVWAYWISQLDLSYHLATSVDRVIAGLMFLCVIAVLHLSGRLAALGAQPPDGN